MTTSLQQESMGIIIEIDGLGVLVRHPNPQLRDGIEVRWSADPEVSANAPAHVLKNLEEVVAFFRTCAVPKHLLCREKMHVISVPFPKGEPSLSRKDCLAAGAKPSSWDMVRTPLCLIGKSLNGPQVLWHLWQGSRSDHQNLQHLSDGLQIAQSKGIAPALVLADQDLKKMELATRSLSSFRDEMHPAQRVARIALSHLHQKILTSNLSQMPEQGALSLLHEAQEILNGCLSVQQAQDDQSIFEDSSENLYRAWKSAEKNHYFVDIEDNQEPSTHFRSPTFH